MSLEAKTPFDEKMETLKSAFEQADKRGYAQAAVVRLIGSMLTDDVPFEDAKQDCLKKLRESFKIVYKDESGTAKERRKLIRATAQNMTMTIIKHIQNGENKSIWDMPMDDLPSHIYSKRVKNAKLIKDKLGIK